mmetsp:Transcript_136673/g.437241  ORF Transcript_136673/g.437241 Transcript_136673/m.437241 type:complete len:276 (-) Transcript_136673:102-929(-)
MLLAVVSEPAKMSVKTLSTMASSLSASPVSSSTEFTRRASSERWPAAPLRQRAIHSPSIATTRVRARIARAAVLHGTKMRGADKRPLDQVVTSSTSFATCSSDAAWPNSTRRATLTMRARSSGTNAKAPSRPLQDTRKASISATMSCSYSETAWGVRLCWMVRRSCAWKGPDCTRSEFGPNIFLWCDGKKALVFLRASSRKASSSNFEPVTKTACLKSSDVFHTGPHFSRLAIWYEAMVFGFNKRKVSPKIGSCAWPGGSTAHNVDLRRAVGHRK